MTKKACLLGLLAFACQMVGAQEKQASFRIRFNSPVTSDVQVIPAILKYNKDFAYCFTFDDAYKDAYSLGFKLLTGGMIAGDGIMYPGIFYTDGCGNKIPFRCGIAWYTANKQGQDIHVNTPGNMSYIDASSMYNSGWDFYNHSYNHESSYNSSVDFLWQLTTNQEAFKTNIGIDFHYCVPPDGDEQYVPYAFQLRTNACLCNSTTDIGYGGGADMTSKIPEKPVYWRHLISDDTYSLEQLISVVDRWIAATGPGKQKCLNEFTHRVSYEVTGASMTFPVFKGYMEHLENTYGCKGNDNGWFASSAEVLDYLFVRDHVTIHLSPNGSALDVLLDYSNVSNNLRYYNLSLLVKGTASVESVTVTGKGSVTSAKIGDSYLINFNLPESVFAGISSITQKTCPTLKGYPNPANDKFFLQVPDTYTDIEVSIYNIQLGKMPDPTILRGSNLVTLLFPQGVYPAGQYFIRVTSKGSDIGFSKVLLGL